MPEEDLEGVAIMLGNVLADWAQRAAAAAAARDWANAHCLPGTAEITRSLPRAVTFFRDGVIGPTAKYARVYRGLWMPVVPDGKGRFGRAGCRGLAARRPCPYGRGSTPGPTRHPRRS